MVISREKFKTAFSSKKKNQQRLARRAKKIQDEIVKIKEQVDGWKKDGVNDDWKMYHSQVSELEEFLKIQLVKGKDNPAEAYRNLKKPKQQARDVVTNIRKMRPLIVKAPGIDLQLNSQILPDFDTLSDEERKEKIKLIAEKVGAGKAIIESLYRDPEEVLKSSPSREDIAAIGWYLRTQAEGVSGGAWRKGALTIPDPGGKIREYLDKCSEVYGRDSSHLKKDQDETHGQARGIDFYEGSEDDDLLLPYGMNALLFQRVERDGQERLYVKMETESARFNPTFSRSDETPESRALQSADIGRAILHLKNLLIKEKDKSGLARHAEKFGDIPKGIKQAYAALRDVVKENPVLDDLMKTGGKVTKKGKLEKMEVQQMAANIQELKKIVQLLGSNREAVEALGLDQEMIDDSRDMLAAWDLLIKEAWGEKAEEQISLRIGDEVIMDLEDTLAIEDPERGPQPPLGLVAIPVAPAANVYDDGLDANPVLYAIVNTANGYNFRVSSGHPGGQWFRVEQFCAYLAAHWLNNGHGTGGLTFAGLPGGDKDNAVARVQHWGGAGGAQGQVGWATGQLGGAAVPGPTALDNIRTGTYAEGTRIWFGNNHHAMGAVIKNDGSVLWYDPNTGSTDTMSKEAFAANPPGGANVFVVA